MAFSVRAHEVTLRHYDFRGMMMRAQLTGKFLATVAASATAAGAGNAVAADYVEADPAAIDSRIAIAFEGGVSKSDIDDDKLGSSDKLGDHDADIYGAISLTKLVSPDIDWRLSGAYHAGSERSWDLSTTGTDPEFDFSLGDDFDFQTIDFDVGKRLQMSQAQVRLFGGLRGLHVKENFNFGLGVTPTDPTADKTTNLDKVGSSDFYGIGPRVGAEIYYPIGETWGLSGSAAGAAIWGRRSTDLGFNLFSQQTDADPPTVINVDVDEDSDEVITNLEFKAGVTWMPWDTTAFTVGYRIDHWDSLLSGFSGLTGDGDGDQDQTFHGPFLKVEVKL
jgi:hypothetical protein